MSAAFSDREPLDYTAHCWLPENRSVAAARSGELLVFKKEDLVMVIPPPMAQIDNNIVCMLSCTRGFLAATERVRSRHAYCRLLQLCCCVSPSFRHSLLLLFFFFLLLLFPPFLCATSLAFCSDTFASDIN
jgi:hypothetical protein